MLPESKKNIRRNEVVLKKARDLGNSATLLSHKASAITLSILYKKKAKLVLQKYVTLTKLVSKNHFINQEIEFVFENFFIVESTISEIENSFKKKDIKKLPLVSLLGTKTTRIYALLEEFIAVTDGKVDRDILLAFLEEYQKESPLSIQEINLVPEILRLILVENFGALIDEAFKKIQDFNDAERIHLLIKKSIASSGGDPSHAISFLASRYKFIPFDLAVHLLNRLSKEGAAMRLVIKWIHLNLEKQGIGANKISSIGKRIRGKHLFVSANAIESLHWLSQVRWESMAEKISVVDSILADDPEGIFSSLEKESKNLYRNTIVRVAERVSVNEAGVARAALGLASRARPKGLLKDTAVRRHIGYYLMDPSGIEMLEKEMRYVPTKWEKLYKMIIGHPQASYFGSIGLFSFFSFYFIVSAVGIFNFGIVALALWLLIAAMFSFEVSLHAVNALFSQFLPVRSLPRIKIEGGIGEGHRTFVAVPSILRSEQSIRELAQKLEVNFIGNSEKNIFFALLFDFKDASEEILETDAALLDCVAAEIGRLNALYGNGSKRFFGLVRKRIWNEKEGVFMGRERKRGKLREFNELLRGKKETSYMNGEGVLSVGRVRYVITLDEDTELPHDTARKLIGTIMHPLNAPVIDGSNHIVRGYGIIQPRIAVHLDAAFSTFFSRLYSSGSGIDSYSISISNFYQDLFGKALFFGKGIYDIDTIELSMSGKIPDNAVLSHDLLEGIYACTGFASDIILFDGFPNFYHEFIVRLERWIRGDWQIIGWISSWFGQARYGVPRESFAFIDRFKIIDNLRRSLLPVVCVSALILGVAANLDIARISTLILIVLASPHIFPFIISLVFLHSVPFSQRLQKVARGLYLVVVHTILKVFFLLQQALISARAIVVTLGRLYFTRKKLLQWKNFYDVGTVLTGRLKEYYFFMGESVVISLFFLAFFTVRGSIDPWLQAWLIIWCVGPVAAFLISRPIGKKERLDEEDIPFVRTVAYRNALYFLENAKEETHWLISDHVQEYPKLPERSRIATSPTNIGMHIVSLVSSFDLGYLSPLRYADRTEKLFSSLSLLYRYRGHLINWYDIKNLEPLNPQYVSSVDSANFLLSLVAAEQAYAEISERLEVEESAFKGLVDATSALIDDARAFKRIAPRSLRGKIQDMISSSRYVISAAETSFRDDSSYDYFNKFSFCHEKLSGILKKVQEISANGSQPLAGQLLFSVEKAIELAEDHMMSLQTLVPYIKHRDPSVGLYASKDDAAMKIVNEVEDCVFSIVSLKKAAEEKPLSVRGLEFEKNISKASLGGEAKDFLIGWYKKLLEDVDSGAEAARKIIYSFRGAEESSKAYIREADFAFLYNKEKELFHIGYNITLDKIDSACYNFIASEANSVSFMAILKGDAPQKHWFYLSRKLARSGRSISLVSWGGSLFEYLTSLIFFPVNPASLLGSAARSAVNIHMHDARQHNTLWGMGESAYYQFDENKQYQYQIFGSSKIGLKRNLIDFLVVAPYTTALSMPFFPDKAVRNLKEFARIGCEGRYGFYDSLDYLSNGKNNPRKASAAKVYYAHHQGFTLASLTNVLEDDRIQKLFHSNPMVQSLITLLEEKMPEEPIAEPLLAPVSVSFPQDKKSYIRDTGLESKRFISTRATLPQHAFISNDLYSICITSGGSSRSLYKGIALTRPSLDEESETEGLSFFLRDKKTKNIYALSPRGMQHSHRQKIIFHENKVEFLSFGNIFDSALSISVDPRLPVEVRELFIRNNGTSAFNLDLMACAEVSLAEPNQIFHHPHYHHLLVQGETIAEDNAIIFHRPHPLDRTKRIYCAHLLASKYFLKNSSTLTASREDVFDRFAQDPSFSSSPQGKNEKYLVPIDPASRIVSGLEIPPGESVSAAWIQIAAESYKEVRRLIKKYKRFDAAHSVTASAVSASALSTRALGISQEQSVIFQEIASQVITGSMKGFSNGRSGETLIHYFWKAGISGNYPIALFFIRDIEDMQVLKQAIQCYEYWKSKGIEIDIVILNDQPGSYLKVLEDEVDLMIRQAKDNVVKKEGSSIYQVKSDLISSEDREAIIAIARFIMDSRKGTLSDTVSRKRKFVKNVKIQKFVPSLKTYERKYPGISAPDLSFYNSWGGFDHDTGEYVMTVSSERMPPKPWSHIIAFEDFGTVVSDSGSSYTWSKDSHDGRISAWTNEVLHYRSGEIIYLRDDDTGEIWNPTPLPVKTKEPFLVRYGFGYASYDNSYSDIRQKLTTFVPCGDTMKVSLLSLENKSSKDRHLTLYYYLEPSTGVLRDNSRDRIFFDYDQAEQTMFFGNEFRNQLPGRTAFASFGRVSGEIGWTSDKREFIGRFGAYESPQALKRVSLSNSAECGLENCIALSLKVDISAGKEVKIPILLGDAPSLEQAKQKASSWKNKDGYDEDLAEVKYFWKQKLGKVSVRTGDLSVDLLMNGWLLYQTLSSRIYAKTGFYQPSGAYGFRDQLQDVCSLIWSDPSFVREFILKAASHQFKEGDALNWWHDHNMFGARTVLSDHQMWLAYALFEYVKATGDRSVFEEEVPFLEGPILSFTDKKEWTGIPEISSEKASVFEHAMRAIEKNFMFGLHGLPLIGTSDWNDGLSRVGHQGKGESIWTTWFLLRLIDIALPHLKERGQIERMDRFASVRDAIEQAIGRSAWDKEWYRRAFFDDGAVLGSRTLKEFKIDSVAQSWAVLSGRGDEEKIRTAHRSMSKMLFKEKYFSLIDPALEKSLIDPGYIRDYPSGIRENGSQYNHAALWAVQSYSHIGEIDDAERIFNFINPIERSCTEEKALEYRIEPYVVASDIYGGVNAGRGGWSWYSGSSGLMYTTILEHILGIQRKSSILSISPRIPKGMKEAAIDLPCGKAGYHIKINNPKGVYSGVLSALRDNLKCDPLQISFIDDGIEHQIEITLG